MNYPMWDVPVIGSGWVIGMIAIFHVMISHFAVGGGIYLPFAERKARKENRKDWLRALEGHSKFFLILTGVYGAASGVGIWFAIGLANPEGTSTLIHNFVFGWAIEWVFFMVELTCAAVYYYTWNRIPAKLHLRVGWAYAIASICTLVIINGILTFMLTPGQAWLDVAGTGEEASRFWQAFFNPTYWPSLFMRILVCMALAGVFGLVYFSRIDGDKEPELKTSLVRWSCWWLVPSFLLMPFCVVWYLAMVPETHQDLLTLGISTIGQGTFSLITRIVMISILTSATILAVVFFFAYLFPREFGLGHAVAVMLLALAATASTEHAREMLRKPYVVGQFMYSNGIRMTEVEKFNKEGYLKRSIWASPDEKAEWRMADAMSSIAPPLPPTGEAHLIRGRLMFSGQCLACHTVDGYRSICELLHGRDRKSISNIVAMLHEDSEDSPYRAFMPPLVGTKGEREALVDYLNWMVNKHAEEKEAELTTSVAAH